MLLPRRAAGVEPPMYILALLFNYSGVLRLAAASPKDLRLDDLSLCGVTLNFTETLLTEILLPELFLDFGFQS